MFAIHVSYYCFSAFLALSPLACWSLLLSLSDFGCEIPLLYYFFTLQPKFLVVFP